MLLGLLCWVVFQGLCTGQTGLQTDGRLLIEPGGDTHTVKEGEMVELTCYLLNERVSKIRWHRDGKFICQMTLRNGCKIIYGPSSGENEGKTQCFCNSSSLTVKVSTVTMADSKTWTCSSKARRKSVQLIVSDSRASGIKPTHTHSFDVTSPKSTLPPSPSIKPSSTTTTQSAPATAMSTSSLLLSNSSVGTLPAGPFDKYKLYIIVGVVVGGILLIVVVVVVVTRGRSHTGANKTTIKQKLVNEEPTPKDDEIVMEENSIYWSNQPGCMNEGSTTTVEAAPPVSTDVYSVVQKKAPRDGAFECVDMTAKPEKEKTENDSKEKYGASSNCTDVYSVVQKKGPPRS